MGKIDLSKFAEAVEEIDKYFSHDLNKVVALTMKQVASEWKDMFDRCVETFYESYDPVYYKRNHGLYKAYRITTNGKTLTAQRDSFYMPGLYKVSTRYIYKYMFEEGWHGGAIDGVGHPEPGTPWWKTPPPFMANKLGVPAWSQWSAMAASSKSPDTLIDEAIAKYKAEQKGEKILHNYFNKIIKNKYIMFNLFK